VGLVYALIVGTSVVHALTWDLVYDPPCVDQYCPRNVFVIWPNEAVDGLVTRTAELAAPLLGLAVIYAVWRHRRGAGPGARRALLPVIVALPVWYLRTSLDYLSAALGIEPLYLALRQPWWIAIDVIIPAGLLLGVLRLRLDRGRVANLMVELGRGIPSGGLRDALARALGDPTLQLAFVGPDPATYIDPSGHPVDLPTGVRVLPPGSGATAAGRRAHHDRRSTTRTGAHRGRWHGRPSPSTTSG
jgi:hypothetical protein